MTDPRLRVRFALIALIGLLGLLVACKTRLKHGKAEQVLRDYLAKHGAVGNVWCPEDVPVNKDVKFTCWFTIANGAKQTINGIETDDQGTVEFSGDISLEERTLAVTINRHGGEQGITQMLAQHGIVVASVECPDQVLARHGEKFTCSCIDSAGGKFLVNVAVDDPTVGSVDLEVVGAVVKIEDVEAALRADIKPPASKSGTLNCPARAFVATATPTICTYVHDRTSVRVEIVETDPVEHAYTWRVVH